MEKQGRLFVPQIDSVVVSGRLKRAEQRELAALAKAANQTQSGFVSQVLRVVLANQHQKAVNSAVLAVPKPDDFHKWPRKKQREWIHSNRKV